MKLKNCRLMQKVVVKKNAGTFEKAPLDNMVFSPFRVLDSFSMLGREETVGEVGEIRIITKEGTIYVWFEKLDKFFRYSPEMLRKVKVKKTDATIGDLQAQIEDLEADIHDLQLSIEEYKLVRSKDDK